jgi:hypothetical protein
MDCGKCGQANPAESTACSNCSQPLTAQAGSPAIAAGAPTPAGPARTDGKAIASLCLGLASWIFCLNFLTGIPAVLLGHRARANIKKSKGMLKGEGMALAGLILGYPSIFALLLLAMAIPEFRSSRLMALESGGVSGVRTINSAEVTYASTYPKVGFSPSLEVLAGSPPCDATAACLIDPLLASGSKGGYRLTYQASDTNGDQVLDTYFVSAVPVRPDDTGMRAFCSDESGVIRYSTSATCTRESPPLQ